MTGFGKFIAGFGHAARGIRYAVATQCNIQVHLAITVAVLIVAALLHIPLLHWIIIILTIAVVLAAELMNTAIETVVDLVSPEFHPLAKIAKDTAAGAVLVCAIGAAIVGIIIFAEAFWS